MLKYLKNSVLITVMTGVVLGSSGSAHAQMVKVLKKSEKFLNTTNKTAFDLSKAFASPIVYCTCDEFAKCERSKAGPYYVARCFGANLYKDGMVHNNETAVMVALTTSTTVKPKGAQWSDEDGAYIGKAKPVGIWVKVTDSREPGETGDVTVELGHSGTNFDFDTNDPGTAVGTITGSEVECAILDATLPDEDMFVADVCDLPSVLCGGEFGFTLDHEASCDDGAGECTKVYNFTDLSEDKVVLCQFIVSGDGGSGTEVFQYGDADVDIPTVSEWGVIAMVLLILAAGTVVIRRSRAKTVRL